MSRNYDNSRNYSGSKARRRGGGGGGGGPIKKNKREPRQGDDSVRCQASVESFDFGPGAAPAAANAEPESGLSIFGGMVGAARTGMSLQDEKRRSGGRGGGGGGGGGGPTTVEDKTKEHLVKLRRMSYKGERFEDVLPDHFLMKVATSSSETMDGMATACRKEMSKVVKSRAAATPKPKRRQNAPLPGMPVSKKPLALTVKSSSQKRGRPHPDGRDARPPPSDVDPTPKPCVARRAPMDCPRPAHRTHTHTRPSPNVQEKEGQEEEEGRRRRRRRLAGALGPGAESARGGGHAAAAGVERRHRPLVRFGVGRRRLGRRGQHGGGGVVTIVVVVAAAAALPERDGRVFPGHGRRVRRAAAAAAPGRRRRSRGGGGP